MKRNVMARYLGGLLSFAAWRLAASLRAQESALTGNGPLYMCTANFDWENHDPAKGVTLRHDKDAHNLVATAGIDPSGASISWAYLEDNLEKVGWMTLNVEASESTRASNEVKAYAGGWAEGLLSAARISQFYSNVYQLMMKDEASTHTLANIKRMFHDTLEYAMANSNFRRGVMTVAPLDPYWIHARYILSQMWGIKDAYNFVSIKKKVHQIDMIDMLIINSHGEMPELMEAYTPLAVKHRREFQSKIAAIQEWSGRRLLRGAVNSAAARSKTSLASSQQTVADLTLEVDADMKHTTPHNQSSWVDPKADREWENRVAKRGRCSAMVRVGPENSDIFVGHTTWDDYSKMTRIFKYYNFKFPGSWNQATHIGMSSYPGCIGSTDNFYMLNSGLVIADTSLEILNPNLYDRILEFPGNSHIPDMVHIMIVNRMSVTGAMWTTLYSEKNSGTGNSQWLVVDYNVFIPGSPIRDNTFWVLEQIPGFIAKADMSGWLRKNGYWAAYNRPYFPETRSRTGHSAAEAKYGALYSWNGNPRAQIFKSYAPTVENMFDMRNLMDRNYYPNEGVDPNEPGHAIAARMDLDPVSQLPNGGIDSKVLGRCLFKDLQCHAISGPSHGKQSVFKWKDDEGKELFPGWPHLGLPNSYNFDWVQMTPSGMLKKVVDVAC